MPESEPATSLPQRAISLFGIAATAVLASGFLGGVTSAINGAVSPQYFVTIMHWHEISDVWRAAIAQGTFEGLCFGVFFSTLFTAGIGIITHTSCTYAFGMRHLRGVLAAAFVCWCLGGVLGTGLAMLSPEFYHATFRGVPDDLAAMLRFAWVGGSIWGIEFGGLLSVVLGLVVVRSSWRRCSQSTSEKC
ncbi:MAG: hypothetical protein HY290_04445 [Planctomycetia bacterium]|nr:hypothetical protein [Planctomycetia bacterium]